MNTYVSTLAFLGKPLEEMLVISSEQGFKLEFSSALPYHPEMDRLFLEYQFPKLAHNYFPAPEAPFVLNLASKEEIIRKRSIEHCLQGLDLTKKAGAAYFSAHAGFCLDPKPEELGKKLKQSEEYIDKESHWPLFKASVQEILSYAKQLDLDFYIENNVTARMNLNIHGQNPLFCSEPHEMIRLYNELNNPRFGLLLDTAHLKVSAKTMNFDLVIGVKQVESIVKAIHHSDNDGLLDTNGPLREDYWFLDLIPRFGNIPQVIEVKKLEIEGIKSHLELINSNRKIYAADH